MTEVISRVLIRRPETDEAVATVMRLRAFAFEALRGDYGGSVSATTSTSASGERPA